MSLLKKIANDKTGPAHSTKVSIIGVGQVGMACAFSIVNQNMASEIVLCDANEDKVEGEVADLQHGLPFLKHVKVTGSGPDLNETTGSKVCIITAGARQREGESRLNLLQRNCDIFKGIIPKLTTHCPDSILLVISNPVDILTFIAWKLSGFPVNRVIGSGTNLDSARFRYLLSEKLGISPSSVHAWIIGEHGDSSVPVWSGVNVAGVPLIKTLSQDSENIPQEWNDLHQRVVHSAYEIIRLKGYTSWAIGLSAATLVQAILKNSHQVFAVSTLAKDVLGSKQEVFLSLPCSVGSNGVTHIVNQNLTSSEMRKLENSANIMNCIQKDLQM